MSNFHSETAGEMSAVYLLWFEWEEKDCELLVGVYSSEPEAKAAIERIKTKKGFSDFPEGLHIYRRELNKDTWSEGFIFDDISR